MVDLFPWHRADDGRGRAETEEEKKGLGGAPFVHVRAQLRYVQIHPVSSFWLISFLQITHMKGKRGVVSCRFVTRSRVTQKEEEANEPARM
jgi:hypothetical protein